MIAMDASVADARLDLLRRAALAGPGYRGIRNETSEATRLAMIAEFRTFGLHAPSYLSHPTQWIERRAKLFEAGDYPDKGVTVSTEDLQALVANFDLPVPVLIEHGDSPLHLGFLIEVSADGTALNGLIALTAEADTLLTRSGAQSLSVGLETDLRHIREVSIVRNPRVADTRLFDSRPLFSTGFADVDYAQLAAKERQTQQLEWATKRVESLVNDGRLAPTQAEAATKLFSCEVAFGGFTIAELAEQVFGSLPKLALFHQVAPVPYDAEASANLLLPEESAFYRRHFPGIDLGEIAKRR